MKKHVAMEVTKKTVAAEHVKCLRFLTVRLPESHNRLHRDCCVRIMALASESNRSAAGQGYKLVNACHHD